MQTDRQQPDCKDLHRRQYQCHRHRHHTNTKLGNTTSMHTEHIQHIQHGVNFEAKNVHNILFAAKSQWVSCVSCVFVFRTVKQIVFAEESKCSTPSSGARENACSANPVCSDSVCAVQSSSHPPRLLASIMKLLPHLRTPCHLLHPLVLVVAASTQLNDVARLQISGPECRFGGQCAIIRTL